MVEEKKNFLPEGQPWKTPFNSHLFKDKSEVNYEPSQTVPNQAMPVSEILRRFAQGLPLGGEKVPLYDADINDPNDPENLPDLSKLDLAEREEIIEFYRKEVSDLTQAQAVAKADAKAQAEIKKREAEKQAKKPDAITDAEVISTNIP